MIYDELHNTLTDLYEFDEQMEQLTDAELRM